jgi:hypothetical protein
MTGSAPPSGGQALLVLEDGTAFAGRPLGAVGRAHGEVVFVNGIRPRVETRGMVWKAVA